MSYPTLVPYLLVPDAREEIEFLEAAFGALPRLVIPSEDGKNIHHAEVTLGDGLLMISDHVPVPHTAYMCHYVMDVDATYAKALAAGAVSVTEPANQEYGQRLAGVRDKAGNTWWICCLLS